MWSHVPEGGIPSGENQRGRPARPRTRTYSSSVSASYSPANSGGTFAPPQPPLSRLGAMGGGGNQMEGYRFPSPSNGGNPAQQPQQQPPSLVRTTTFTLTRPPSSGEILFPSSPSTMQSQRPATTIPSLQDRRHSAELSSSYITKHMVFIPPPTPASRGKQRPPFIASATFEAPRSSSPLARPSTPLRVSSPHPRTPSSPFPKSLVTVNGRTAQGRPIEFTNRSLGIIKSNGPRVPLHQSQANSSGMKPERCAGCMKTVLIDFGKRGGLCMECTEAMSASQQYSQRSESSSGGIHMSTILPTTSRPSASTFPRSFSPVPTASTRTPAPQVAPPSTVPSLEALMRVQYEMEVQFGRNEQQQAQGYGGSLGVGGPSPWKEGGAGEAWMGLGSVGISRAPSPMLVSSRAPTPAGSRCSSPKPRWR